MRPRNDTPVRRVHGRPMEKRWTELRLKWVLSRMPITSERSTRSAETRSSSGLSYRTLLIPKWTLLSWSIALSWRNKTDQAAIISSRQCRHCIIKVCMWSTGPRTPARGSKLRKIEIQDLDSTITLCPRKMFYPIQLHLLSRDLDPLWMKSSIRPKCHLK